MKRFVTYLYEYENGHKMKNAGFLRVDIRNQMVNMQISIRCPELSRESGKLYIIVRDENVYGICLGEIQMKEGLYQGSVNCRYQAIEESPYSFSDVIGVGIHYENGCYLASSWKDEEDEVIARGDFMEYGSLALDETELSLKPQEAESIDDITEGSGIVLEEQIEAAEVDKSDNAKNASYDLIYEETFDEDTYRKINLNEIATLPSRHWHFSNNSFLMHGFWNYGYLVLKESVEKNQKRMSLGIPGIFEQPEMVMATYFGFPEFEALPPQVVEMEIGAEYRAPNKTENQPPQVGVFGCWFVNL